MWHRRTPISKLLFPRQFDASLGYKRALRRYLCPACSAPRSYRLLQNLKHSAKSSVKRQETAQLCRELGNKVARVCSSAITHCPPSDVKAELLGAQPTQARSREARALFPFPFHLVVVSKLARQRNNQLSCKTPRLQLLLPRIHLQKARRSVIPDVEGELPRA